MLDKIEMSLEEIIKSNKQPNSKGKRRGGENFKKGPINKKFGGAVVKGRARGGITRSKYTRGDVNSSWKHDLFEGRKAATGGLRIQTGTSKLIVSNLDFSVSDADINELFAEFGPLKAASVHYDRSGRSLGTADVVFERRNDAVKAMKQYNGVPLDGRPMTIQLAASEVQQRIPIQRTSSVGQNRQSTRGFSRGPARGQRRGHFGRPGVRRVKQEVTVDDLNAELDAYTMQG